MASCHAGLWCHVLPILHLSSLLAVSLSSSPYLTYPSDVTGLALLVMGCLLFCHSMYLMCHSATGPYQFVTSFMFLVFYSAWLYHFFPTDTESVCFWCVILLCHITFFPTDTESVCICCVIRLGHISFFLQTEKLYVFVVSFC